MTIKIIAEVGSNFSPGNLESAKKMIATAAECGADVVKFQILDVDNINRPQWWRDKCKPWDMPDNWHAKLHDEALRLGIDLLYSVFTAQKVALYMACYQQVKIGSSEISNQRLLYTINSFVEDIRFLPDRSWITDVYMSVPPDKHAALIPALTWLNNCRVTLMHCVPEYPTSKELAEAQLGSITELLKLGLPVGWSSHVAYPDAVHVAWQARNLGATVVEAHLRDFDTPDDAPDNGDWSLYPGEFAELVREVRSESSKV